MNPKYIKTQPLKEKHLTRQSVRRAGRNLNRIQKPVSVNLAVTQYCNYECKFCFGHYRSLESEADYSRVMQIPLILASMGTEKLTIEGGEPFLFTELDSLLRVSKSAGLTTSIISNGSLITRKHLVKLAPYLDWLGLSVDSPKEETEIRLGRGVGHHIEQVRRVAGWARKLGIRLKINVVVSALNVDDDLSELLLDLKPDRVKMFQFLPIKGENEEYSDELKVSEEEFLEFVERHKHLEEKGMTIVGETNDDMKGSYIMMLPDGRFFTNEDGIHRYSKHTIFEENPFRALEEVGWNTKKFIERGGLYDWASMPEPKGV